MDILSTLPVELLIFLTRFVGITKTTAFFSSPKLFPQKLISQNIKHFTRKPLYDEDYVLLSLHRQLIPDKEIFFDREMPGFFPVDL